MVFYSTFITGFDLPLWRWRKMVCVSAVSGGSFWRTTGVSVATPPLSNESARCLATRSRDAAPGTHQPLVGFQQRDGCMLCQAGDVLWHGSGRNGRLCGERGDLLVSEGVSNGASAGNDNGADRRGSFGGSGGGDSSGANPNETVPSPHWSMTDVPNDDDEEEEETLSSRPRRALLLISDTGGGHRASAYAIRDAMNELYPGAFEWFIVDMWVEWTLWPFSSMPQSYQFLAKNPPLWRAAYCYGSFLITRRLTEEVTNAIVHDRVRAAISCIRPDLVISLHPLTQMLPLRVLRRMGLREYIPFVTVVTDLGGAHATWFDPDADLIFVASDAVRNLALKCGVQAERIRQHGLPVRPEFWADAERNYETELASVNRVQRITESRRAWRRRLGFLEEHQRTVLIVGGGDGVGGITRIARTVVERLDALAAELATSSNPSRGFQVIVVCGRNERARRDLVQWGESRLRHRASPVDENRTRMTVFGFVSNMGELMAASDAIVTKAGPGTIAEALIRGLPIMLSGFLPGQEEGNVPFVVNHGVGEYQHGPHAIANRLAEWLADDTLLLRMAMRARDMGKPLATYEICQDIAELARKFPGYPESLCGAAAGDLESKWKNRERSSSSSSSAPSIVSGRHASWSCQGIGESVADALEYGPAWATGIESVA
ncbi:hypothetical protein CCYA_CCYA11G3012 [Cyanidiococcus yangmingshanensis]|nr:hypothetical protein CCYA_CCYA11G3012 [Cyanidiococcus yangmingshanensis]